MARVILLEEEVEDFYAYAKTKYYDRDYLKNLKIFMDYLVEECGKNNIATKKDCEQAEEYAKEIVRGSKAEYPLLKATKVDRGKFFNAFVDFERQKYNWSLVKLEKIPFVMNELERKLDLVKHYREYYLNDKLDAKTVADKYYVDEKTIRNDKREIKDGTLNAFGQKIDIEYDEDTKSFFSTPVPIFTVQNITQIVTILNGLGIMYRDRDYSEYALYSAVTIWNQLTLSVKKRILENLVEMLSLDKEWYKLISEETDYYYRGFYPEHYMTTPESGNLLMYFKNDFWVDIDYAEGEEIRHLSHVKISNISQDTITVYCNQEEIELKKDNVIHVKENGN